MAETSFYPANNAATAYPVVIDLSDGDWTSPFKNLGAESPMPLSSLYVGTEGDLVVVFSGRPDYPVLLKNHSAGMAEMPIIRIVKEGTGAADMVAFFNGS